MRGYIFVGIAVAILIVEITLFYPVNYSEHQKSFRTPVLRDYYTPDHYPSFQEINHTLHQIAEDHPDITRVFSIGHTWGWNPSTQRYDWPKPLWTIEISDNPGVNESEPRVYIHWHHAREWIDPAFMMYLINSLVNGYYNNDTIHWIIDHYDIFITPLSNADGYVIDGNGNLNNVTQEWYPPAGGWRKNARDNDGDGTFEITDKWWTEGEGVDPERNWDWHWSEGTTDPNASTYHGPYPFSEPEVRAERDFIVNYSIDAQCVLHSYHASILIPWFYTSQNTPHDSFYRDFAYHMSLRTKIEGDPTQHYDYGRPDEVLGSNYHAYGSSSGWVYGILNKIGIAVEMEPTGDYLGDGFHPDTSKIATYIDDLYEAMIYFIEISSTKLKDPSEASNQPNAYIVWGYVHDDTGNPISGATVTIRNTENGDEISATTDEHGFYMLNLGTLQNAYSSTTTFEISVNGATQQFTPNNDMGSQRIDITTSPVPEFNDTGIGLFIIIATAAIIIKIRKFE